MIRTASPMTSRANAPVRPVLPCERLPEVMDGHCRLYGLRRAERACENETRTARRSSRRGRRRPRATLIATTRPRRERPARRGRELCEGRAVGDVRRQDESRLSEARHEAMSHNPSVREIRLDGPTEPACRAICLQASGQASCLCLDLDPHRRLHSNCRHRDRPLPNRASTRPDWVAADSVGQTRHA